MNIAVAAALTGFASVAVLGGLLVWAMSEIEKSIGLAFRESMDLHTRVLTREVEGQGFLVRSRVAELEALLHPVDVEEGDGEDLDVEGPINWEELNTLEDPRELEPSVWDMLNVIRQDISKLEAEVDRVGHLAMTNGDAILSIIGGQDRGEVNVKISGDKKEIFELEKPRIIFVNGTRYERSSDD